MNDGDEITKLRDMRAAFIALMPSLTVPGAASVQIGGEVESQLGRKSIYQGQHR